MDSADFLLLGLCDTPDKWILDDQPTRTNEHGYPGDVVQALGKAIHVLGDLSIPAN